MPLFSMLKQLHVRPAESRLFRESTSSKSRRECTRRSAEESQGIAPLLHRRPAIGKPSKAAAQVTTTKRLSSSSFSAAAAAAAAAAPSSTAAAATSKKNAGKTDVSRLPSFAPGSTRGASTIRAVPSRGAGPDSRRAALAVVDQAARQQARLSDPLRRTRLATRAEFVKHALSLSGGKAHHADSIVGFIRRRSAQKQKELALAWLLVATHEIPDGILTLVDRTLDRIRRCESAQKQAYVMTVQQGSAYLTSPPTTRETPWEDIHYALAAAQEAVLYGSGSSAGSDGGSGGGKIRKCGAEVVPYAAREALSNNNNNNSAASSVVRDEATARV